MKVEEVIKRLVRLGYTITCYLDEDGEMIVSLINEDVAYDRDMATLEELEIYLEEIEDED